MADDRVRIPGMPWPAPGGLELRHLRAFVVVAQHRHFGRAAVRLHLSQPALSRQIAKLERLIGCPLFERSARDVAPTPAGRILFDHAQTIIADVDRAVSSSRWAAEREPDRIAALTGPLLDVLERDVGLDALRATYEAVMAVLPMPQGIGVRPMPSGGVPGLIVSPEPVAVGDRPGVLYLHGGGYVIGSAYGHRPLAGALATTLNRDVFVSDYRLAPEHPYPAALEDALAAYRWLVDDSPAEGPIVIGDSAGAGLALSLMLSLRRLDLPLPACAALLSPWIDPAPDATPGDPENDAARWVREFTTRHGHLVDLDAAAVNPLRSDLSGLPPVLLQVGDADPTADQARELADRLARVNDGIALQTFPAGTHVFHHFWSFLAPAVAALDELGRFVEGRPAEVASGPGR